MELDIQAELLLLQAAGAQRIYIAHHQPPRGQRRAIGASLDHLDHQSLIGTGQVAGKFTYLIRLGSVGVFVCHGQNIVWLECCVQCDGTQFGIQMIFAGG